ncbi:MAG TPA: methionine--tRNA ligase subunit beta, partial [Gemmataceae bacterium]
PKSVYGHGWLLTDTGKMSKSKGNVVDPNRLIDHFGSDAIRYFLLREVSFGQDARYTPEALIERINSDLANDLGNSLHRSVAMLKRFCGGTIPQPGAPQEVDNALRRLVEETHRAVDQSVRSLRVNEALAHLWVLVRAVNKYIDDTQPWNLAKAQDPSRLHTVMYHLFEALRAVALLVSPFLPRTGQRMWEQLGLEGKPLELGAGALNWGGLRPGTQVPGGDPLFPRLDPEEALARLEGEPVAAGAQAGQGAAASQVSESGGGQHGTPLMRPAAQPGAQSQAKPHEKPEKESKGADGVITIDDFAKVQLRTARVLQAERIQGADKLLKLQIDLGSERRQIVAGIAQHYTPGELVGKTIVVVANLQPARLRGEISQGMLLAASDESGRLALVTVEREVAPGSTVR